VASEKKVVKAEEDEDPFWKIVRVGNTEIVLTSKTLQPIPEPYY
jgi:hypothetical protein